MAHFVKFALMAIMLVTPILINACNAVCRSVTVSHASKWLIHPLILQWYLARFVSLNTT